MRCADAAACNWPVCNNCAARRDRQRRQRGGSPHQGDGGRRDARQPGHLPRFRPAAAPDAGHRRPGLRALHAHPEPSAAPQPRRLRRDRPGTDRHRQDGGVPHHHISRTCGNSPGMRTRQQPPGAAPGAGAGADPGTGHADRERCQRSRHPHAGNRPLRRRRHRLPEAARRPALRPDRYPDRHAGPPHRLPEPRPHRAALRRDPGHRRGRPHARHGLHSGRAAHRLPHARTSARGRHSSSAPPSTTT